MSFIPLTFPQDYDGVLEEDVYIQLEYTGCYQGSFCPRFQVTVLGSGTVIFEGEDDVAKTGIIEKQINKQKVADLLSFLLKMRYFERQDDSSNCDTTVNLNGGNYEESGGICFTSNHGPFTDINVRFGDLSRQVQLDHYFSDDYVRIRDQIITVAGVESLISLEKMTE